MGNEHELGVATRVLLSLALFTVVVAGIKAASAILQPFLLAGLVTIICAPMAAFLQRKGLSETLSVIVVVAAILVLGIVIGAFASASFANLTRMLPEYQASLLREVSGLLDLLQGMGVTLDEKSFKQAFDPSAAVSMAAGVLGGIGSLLTNGFMIILTTTFLLMEASSFPKKLTVALKDARKSLDGFDLFAKSVNDYLAIKTIVSFITGVVIFVFLLVVGVNHALLWAFLAFLLNYVPNIGSIIAAVPAVLLAFIQFGVEASLLVISGYVVVNVVMGNIIEPRFLGQGLGLSTLVVFLSLVFWGWVLGPVGMLLSIPLTMILKIAFENDEDTRWIAVMLGPVPKQDKIQG